MVEQNITDSVPFKEYENIEIDVLVERAFYMDSNTSVNAAKSKSV